jgi:hypothetical protein
MRHYVKDKQVWCVHDTNEDDVFHLEQLGKTIYDDNHNCIECMEYFYDPHQPDCKFAKVDA